MFSIGLPPRRPLERRKQPVDHDRFFALGERLWIDPDPIPARLRDLDVRVAFTEPPDDLVYWDELEIRGRKAKMKLWALAVEKTELEPAAEAPAETQDEPEPAPQPANG